MSTSEELENRIEALESRYAFQEDTIQQLDDIIVEQRTRLERLEKSLRLLVDDLLAQKNLDPASAADDDPQGAARDRFVVTKKGRRW